jgi:hypothetical protein
VVALTSKRFSFVHVVVPAVLIVAGFGIFQAAGALTTAPANKYTGPEEKPQQWYTNTVTLSPGAAGAPMAVAPTGQALVIKNAHAFEFGAASASGGMWLDLASDPVQCSTAYPMQYSGTYSVDTFNVGTTNVDMTYQPGIAIPAGYVLCGRAYSAYVDMQLYGYALPSAYAVTPAAALHPLKSLHLKLP